jgi:D-sedoheptulose 7-phosphate isomerase
MDYKFFFKNYSQEIAKLLSNVDTNLINETVNLIKKKIDSDNTIYIVGNGGSSSIANHVSVDFTKVARVKSKTFNNSNIITCFANDYGHDNWVKEAILAYCSKEDLIIIISSSGKSLNMVNAAKYCRENHYDLITFSGFEKNNELSKLGQINFHVDSKNYNYIEMTHHIILVSIVDIFSQKIQ